MVKINHDKNIFPWIGKTAKMLDYFHNQKLQENGFNLTKEQWVLLNILSNNNGLPQNTLACITNRDKTSLTRLISTLERKKLVSRVSNKKDKRINQIYITKEGKEILKETQEIWLELSSILQKNVSQTEVSQAISTLKKIQDNINSIYGC